MAVAGCEPDEIGVGPVFAAPRLMERRAGGGMGAGGLFEVV